MLNIFSQASCHLYAKTSPDPAPRETDGSAGEVCKDCLACGWCHAYRFRHKGWVSLIKPQVHEGRVEQRLNIGVRVLNKGREKRESAQGLERAWAKIPMWPLKEEWAGAWGLCPGQLAPLVAPISSLTQQQLTGSFAQLDIYWASVCPALF